MAWTGGKRRYIFAAGAAAFALTAVLSVTDGPLSANGTIAAAANGSESVSPSAGPSPGGVHGNGGSATANSPYADLPSAPPGTLTLTETADNAGYDAGQTSPATAADPLPPGFDTYVEDAHQDLHFSYLVTNNGGSPLSGIAVTGSLAADARCPHDTLRPGESETCTATHVTTAADIAGTIDTRTLVDHAIAVGGNSVEMATAKAKFAFTAPVYALNVSGDGPFGSCNDIAQDGGTPQGSAPSERVCINHVLGKILTLNSQPGYDNPRSPGVVDPVNTPVVLDLMGGSYEVDSGLYFLDHQSENDNPVTHHPDPGDNDIWVENGSLYDGTKADKNPVITMDLGQNIYLDDLTVRGTDRGGYFELPEYNNAAIRVDGTKNLVINNWNAQYVFGDGINLEPFLCKDAANCSQTEATISNVVVEHDGRCGLAPIGMTRTTFTNVTILYPGMSSIDIEADSPNTVPGSLTINNLTMSGMFELSLVTGHSGAITVNNWTEVPGASGGFPDSVIWLKNNKGIKTPLHGALTINNSYLECSGYSAGPFGACIVNEDGVVAPSDILSCGTWGVDDPCSPGLILNNDVINMSHATGNKPIGGNAGGWTVFNSSCVVDTSGANYGPPRYRGGLDQLTGADGVFAAGTLCARARNTDGPTEVTPVPMPVWNQQPPPEEPAAFTDPNDTNWTITCTERVPCSYTIGVTGSPTPKVQVAYVDYPLRSDLNLRNNSGAPVVQGTPGKGSAGSYTVWFAAGNGDGLVVQQYLIVINPAS